MYKIKISLVLGYDAPCLYIVATSEQEALKQARKQSGLGRFPEWKFTVIK